MAVDPDQAVFQSAASVLLQAKQQRNFDRNDPSFLAGATRVLKFMFRMWRKGEIM